METLQNIDWLILYVVNGSHIPLMDDFFILVSRKYIWLPLYILLAVIFIKKLGLKNGLIVIAGALVCFAITDLVSARIIKPWVARPRPCQTLTGSQLWLPDKCGGMYGFVSNHAANTMGIAVFCILIFTKKIKGQITIPMVVLLILYPLLNSFARVYLGKHYPTDVLGGVILGSLVALGVYWITTRLTTSPKKLSSN